MSIPATLPTDPANPDEKRVALSLPDFIYWQLVSVAETEDTDIAHMFVLACRALIADFDGVEAIALKRVVTHYASQGYSDPAIGQLLGIPPRRVRAVRTAFGIESQVKGRGRKIVSPVTSLTILSSPTG